MSFVTPRQNTHHLETVQYTLHYPGGIRLAAQLRHVLGHRYKLGQRRLVQRDHVLDTSQCVSAANMLVGVMTHIHFLPRRCVRDRLRPCQSNSGTPAYG